MKLTANLFCLSTLLVIAVRSSHPAAAQEQTPAKRIIAERLLGKFDLSQIDPKKGLWVSPDGRRVAWLTKDQKGLVIDGKLIEFQYPGRMRHFTFSPDSKRTALAGYGKQGETLFLDGVEAAKGYNTVSPGPVFSPDGKHVAYIARLSASEFATTLVVDDKELGTPNKESGSWNLTFSSDSRRVIYGVDVDKKCLMREVSIDDSQPTIEHKHGPAVLTVPFLRGAGGQIGYVAKDEQGQFVFYDGKEDKLRFKEIDRNEVVLSPDGKRVAYAAEPASFSKVIVVDGVKSKVYKDLAKGTLTFSPNSKRVAYAVRDFSRYTPVIDGQEGKVYRGLDAIVFSPDSKRVAYRAFGDKMMIVLDGKEGPGYDGLGLPVFSPDSKSLAVEALLGKREFLLLNGQPDKKAYDLIGAPVFSPDGKRLVYLAKTAGKWRVVESGKEQKAYDNLREEFYFSPDSRTLATIVLDADKQMVVLNGVEGQRYDTIFLLGGAKVHFDDGGKLHYLATKDGELLSVEETLE